MSVLLGSLAMAEPKPGRGYNKKRYATPEPGIEMLALSLGTIAASLAFRNQLSH